MSVGLTRTCPYCGASMPADARKCSACGALMPDAPVHGASPQAAPAQGAPADAHARGALNADVRRVLQSEGKIAAIKFVRVKTGLGLREAKDYVEAIEAGRDPGPVVPAPPKTGCATAVVLLIVVIVSAVLVRVLMS